MKYIIITKKHLTIAASIILAAVFTVVCSVGVYANSNRKLPIYCVETEKKQDAL